MRLIDADALLEIVRRDWSLFQGATYIGDQARRDELTNVIAEIINAPTIEAEPVVRCKDCIYWQDNNGGYINEWCKWRTDETPDPEDFCSCGDRKQDKEGE